MKSTSSDTKKNFSDCDSPSHKKKYFCLQILTRRFLISERRRDNFFPFTAFVRVTTFSRPFIGRAHRVIRESRKSPKTLSCRCITSVNKVATNNGFYSDELVEELEAERFRFDFFLTDISLAESLTSSVFSFFERCRFDLQFQESV